MVNVASIKDFVVDQYPRFGETKQREVVRLLFEIAKRENCHFKDVVKQFPSKDSNFDTFKSYLIKRRFPLTTATTKEPRFVLPEVNVNEEDRVVIKNSTFTLRDVFIEESVCDSLMVKRLRSKYKNANFQIIDNYKKHAKNGAYKISDYNNRLQSFYIVKENYDFYRRCPCSHKSLFCGYHVVNLGSGCSFECTYCYLQDYINSKGIVLPANLEDFFEAFKCYKKDIRVGSGEITDSLVFDHITEYSPEIVKFFKDYPKSYFEFKTKSDNIDLLLDQSHAGNIIISWTMSPQSVINSVEHYTASLDQRIEAAKKCADQGYRVAFHFDPIIYFDGWEAEYKNLADRILNAIDSKNIHCMSLGTLRMTPRLKKIIESRFPETKILDEEFVLGHDGKLRYPQSIRQDIYNKMLKTLRSKAPDVFTYLCMEDKDTCQSCEAAPMKGF